MSVALTERQEREIQAFCQIARENGAAISLRELIELAAIDASEHELAMAFHSDSKLRSKYLLESGYVLERLAAGEESWQQAVEDEEKRRERGRDNLKRASAFGRALVSGAVLVSVSGANAYLSAREDEDIDFFCVTKTNGVWPFMLRALIIARIHRLANREVPELCFSCVMDEKWASQEFGKRQPPIFARDALTAKVIGGSPAYHALLKEAPWMADYFPAFYNMRLGETASPGRQPLRPRTAEKEGSALLNTFLYHTLGVFLRMKSWTLNRRLTKAGRHSAIFVTRRGPGHYIYESNRYRKLRKMYGEIERDE
ncbi:MAG: hypothetical protein OK442_00410 [Thaumarchaeota archaeon]|nr:hypothetical protein [Nitrososphaerota archaeon]